MRHVQILDFVKAFVIRTMNHECPARRTITVQRCFVKLVGRRWAAGIYWGTQVEPEGLERSEMYLEKDIDRQLDPGTPDLTDWDVLRIIYYTGIDALDETRERGLLEGDFDLDGTFTYGVDFFLGDTVHVYLDAIQSPARIVEVVRSYSKAGNNIYMTVDFIDIQEVVANP